MIGVLLRTLRLGSVKTSLLSLICLSALAIVFAFGYNNTAFAYIVYPLSAYALAAFVVGFPKMKSEIKAFVYSENFFGCLKSLVKGNKYGNRIITDVALRVQISLYATLSFDLIYAVFRIVAAWYYLSFWFATEALFYMILSGVRFMLSRFVSKSRDDLRHELLAYRFCGYLLFVMNAALTVVVHQMIHQGRGYHFPGLLIYAAAVYAFICLIVASVQIAKYRKYKSPVLSAVKVINLTKALVAMFSLQIAMFASFGGDKSSELMMNNISGGILCFSIFSLAVFMVIRASNNLRMYPIQ